MQVYTGTLAARLTRGNWSLCPGDCHRVTGSFEIFATFFNNLMGLQILETNFMRLKLGNGF